MGTSRSSSGSKGQAVVLIVLALGAIVVLGALVALGLLIAFGVYYAAAGVDG